MPTSHHASLHRGYQEVNKTHRERETPLRYRYILLRAKHTKQNKKPNRNQTQEGTKNRGTILKPTKTSRMLKSRMNIKTNILPGKKHTHTHTHTTKTNKKHETKNKNKREWGGEGTILKTSQQLVQKVNKLSNNATHQPPQIH